MGRKNVFLMGDTAFLPRSKSGGGHDRGRRFSGG